MKLSICGKGGSGKSTLVALLASEFVRRGKDVLVVDSDESNAGLHWMLGMESPPRPLMELAGGRKNVRRTLRGEAAGDEKSVLARDPIRLDYLPAGYVRAGDGVRLVAVGKIHQALEGCACPIGALSREFLKRLLLADNEVALVDMEAGIEHFGRGVETSIDSVVAVVEPSLESVGLAERVMTLASASGARFAGAVLNKIDSETLAEKLAKALRSRGVTLLGSLQLHPEFVDAGLEGRSLPHSVAADELRPVADAIVAASSPVGG